MMRTEKSLGILIADLSGYTALSEVHGGEAAFQVIEKYLELARKSLRGQSRILERAGDQLIIVSDDADDLAATAKTLLEMSRAEPLFLHVHAGLHFGPVVEQNGQYFGPTINLAARIASTAKGGKLLCSGEFLEALSTPEHYRFQSIGRIRFKNVMAEKEIFELMPETKEAVMVVHIDPVCKMQLQDGKSLVEYEQDGKKYYFCSATCKELFEKHISEYLTLTP